VRSTGFHRLAWPPDHAFVMVDHAFVMVIHAFVMVDHDPPVGRP